MIARKKLILLPGLDGTEIFFGPLLRELPAWIDPVVVTYPNSGPNAYEDLVPLVSKAVESLADCVILGWSFGGPLALMVASRIPTRVSGVVLCASFVSPPHPKLAPFRFALTTPVVATVRAIRRTRLLFPGHADAAMRRAKAMTWRRVSARTLAARSRAALSVNVRLLLAECRTPTMYMASTRDEVIPREKLQEVLEIAPRTKVTQIEGPHMALFTNPSQSAARIADFLREQDGS
jgi:pimeloyl-ACP methyl ester carboxylesterase